jgi:hypothetical protein
MSDYTNAFKCPSIISSMGKCGFCNDESHQVRFVLLPHLKYPRDQACPKCMARLIKKGAKRWGRAKPIKGPIGGRGQA